MVVFRNGCLVVPDWMTEIAITQFGDPDVLKPVRVPVPEPGPDELLIRVAAAGVNRPDVLQRLGKYPLPKDAHPTPGLEVAGEIVAVGPHQSQLDRSGFAVGDPVCALTNGGGYAEYCVVPVGQTLPWPEGFNALQAAALPETYFTVWANLFQTGGVQRGETVLVHGGTSGIGMTAVQLAQPFGYNVIATAGSAEKCTALQRLGATAVNYREQDFVAAVKSITNHRGAEIVLDIIGAAYWDRNLQALAPRGRLLLIGFLGGSIAKEVDLAQILAKRLMVTGSAMRPRSLQEKTQIAAELLQQVWPCLGRGRIEPVIHATFPLHQAAEAHRLMQSSQHIGKIMLTVNPHACTTTTHQ